MGIARYASMPAARCSAGMRARISIARSLVATPALLLLDEPGRSLDEEGRRLLWQTIDRRTELTCVVASHHADDGNRCQQRLALDGGRMTPLTGPRLHPRPAPPAAGPAPRLGPAAGGRAVLALARRDLGERQLIRLPLLLDLVFGVVNLLVFLFISRVSTPPEAHRLLGATTYFDFVAVGITFMLVLQAASTQLTSRVTRERRGGTLELLAAQPVPASALAVGTAAYPFLLALLRAGFYLVLLHALFGLHTARADWWGVVTVLVAGSAAMMGIGIGLTAFAVAVGYGESAARLLIVGLSFLSGTYFRWPRFPVSCPP